MADTIYYRFVVKRDIAANFVTKNTLLLAGEFGLETDTGLVKLSKDGLVYWNDLPYKTILNVDLTGLADGMVLVYNATDNIWKVAALSGGGGGDDTLTWLGF